LFKGVYFRDERQISETTNGVAGYTNKDGSKLAIDSVVAIIYSSKEEIFIQEKITELETQKKALSDAGAFAGTDNSQLEAFSGQLSDKHLQILQCIDVGDYETASKYKTDYLNLQSKFNVIKNDSSGYSAKIYELENEITRLKGLINSPRNLTISDSGYFVSTADGYENILNYDSALSISKEQIEDIVKNPVLEVSSGVIGKMIDGYKWRMAAVIETEKMKGVYEGNTVNLRIGSSAGSVKVTVKNVYGRGDGTAVYIFECDLLIDEFVKKRVTSVRLLLDNYSGIRIPQSAVYFENDVRGVYILNGSVSEFRKINVLNASEDYLIVENTNTPGYLKLYDKVIVSGKDLYDGKIIS
jgi:putative membrane fusion protein